MTAQEFSSEFDLLYNNVSSAQAPGLTEYEKSVFLTKAQDEIVKNYFTNVKGGNKYEQGVEDSEKRYADFSALLTVATLAAETAGATPFDERGKLFKLPDGTGTDKKVMIVITENFRTGMVENALTSYQVIPLKFDEYIRLMSKPSSDPLKKQVWKLMGNSESGNGSIEIVPHWKDKDNTINNLIIKYIRRPRPIILEDLSYQNLSIEGEQGKKDVIINESRLTFEGVIVEHDADDSELRHPFTLTVDKPTVVLNTPELIPDNINNIMTIDEVSESSVTIIVYPKRETMSRPYICTNPIFKCEDLSLEDLSSMLASEDEDYYVSFDADSWTWGYYTEEVDRKVCELAEELHPEILQRAVELAKIFYNGDNQQVLTAGTRSE